MTTLVPLDKRLGKGMVRIKVGSLTRLTSLHMPPTKPRAPSQPPQPRRSLVNRTIIRSLGSKSSPGLFRVNDKEIEDIADEPNNTEDSLILELNDLLIVRKQEKRSPTVQRKVIKFHINKQKSIGSEGSKNPLFAKQSLNKTPLMHEGTK